MVMHPVLSLGASILLAAASPHCVWVNGSELRCAPGWEWVNGKERKISQKELKARDPVEWCAYHKC